MITIAGQLDCPLVCPTKYRQRRRIRHDNNAEHAKRNVRDPLPPASSDGFEVEEWLSTLSEPDLPLHVR